jgi:hypothetical protein
MRVSRKDIGWAVTEGVISEGQAEDLCRALERRNAGDPRFDLPHVAYYFGALVVISAMTWFMTLGWERFGGGGIFAISLSYAVVFVVAGGLLWRDKGLKVPGGLLVTTAVCMTPLAVYGFETMTGLWLQGMPGEYVDFYNYIKGGWFPMGITAVAAGFVALRFFRFPFLTAPIAFALWFMSMDLTPLIYGSFYYEAQGYLTVSLVDGIACLRARRAGGSVPGGQAHAGELRVLRPPLRDVRHLGVASPSPKAGASSIGSSTASSTWASYCSPCCCSGECSWYSARLACSTTSGT